MDLSYEFYAVTILAVLITGISKSGFGGGLGVMAVPLMSLFVSPQFAAAVLMPILLAMDILIVARYRRHWDRQIIGKLLPGAVLGLSIGAAMFQWMNADMVRLAVGLLALFFFVQYAVGQLATVPVQSQHRLIGTVLGAVSGFSSYVAHAGGPPVKGFLLRQNLEKSAFVGTNTVFFFIMNATKTISYGAFGTMTADSLIVTLKVSPFLLLGVFLGFQMHHRIDQTTFVRIAYIFMAFTGVKLLWDSLSTILT